MPRAVAGEGHLAGVQDQGAELVGVFLLNAGATLYKLLRLFGQIHEPVNRAHHRRRVSVQKLIQVEGL